MMSNKIRNGTLLKWTASWSKISEMYGIVYRHDGCWGIWWSLPRHVIEIAFDWDRLGADLIVELLQMGYFQIVVL